MSLTQAQLQALKADIQGNTDQTVIDALANGDTGSIANWYNQNRVPDYWVWKTAVDKHDVYSQSGVGVDGVTVTNWDWTLFSGLNSGEQGSWIEMFNETGVQNPSLPNVRSGWEDIFAGPQAGPTAQRNHINAISRRKATRAEYLFRTNTANGLLAATPDTMGWEGFLTSSHVSQALQS